MERRDGVAHGSADDRFLRLFEDLEAQEAGRAQHERLGEFSDLVAGEAADHSLTERLAGSIGARAGVTVAGVRFAGRLQRVSLAWISVAVDGGGGVLIALAHVDELRVGSRAHAAPPESLSFASPLREWREARVPCAVAALGAAGGVRTLVGTLSLVAADYIEVEESSRREVARERGDAPAGRLLVPLSRVAFVRPEGRVL
ncbi:hypothetical protein [Brevibacterium yomogidense]|uniref:hypothetical protein n=1 Tax=Brevibacterium yomogidense TaxID=946573 RepID=UPI0018DF31B2|nr:hypothetical protein [Brevibacterium yomogidense]